MPSRWALTLRVPEIERTGLHHLHGLLCTWLESGLGAEQHHAHRKPFTMLPPSEIGADTWRLEIGLLDDRLVDRLDAAVHDSLRRGIRLGPTRGEVLAPLGVLLDCTGEASWRGLVERAEPRSVFSFRFRSPTAFRQGRHYQPLPLPVQVFGHYRRTWETFGPGRDSIRIDLPQCQLLVEHLEGRTLRVKLSGGTAVGFVGSATYRAAQASPAQRRMLDALASLARFAGTGAGTTRGMGATDYLRD